MLASASAWYPAVSPLAGSDSGGGAGVQADLKAFARSGLPRHERDRRVDGPVHRRGALRTRGSAGVHQGQLEVVFADIGVDAAKTGMLFSRRIVETVAELFSAHRVTLVVDPVMVAASGAQLLQDDAVEVLVRRLLPLATVATPNLHEACALAGRPYSDDASREELARRSTRSGLPL